MQAQIKEVDKQRKKVLAEDESERLEKARMLMSLRAIGIEGGWVLTMEFFGWRQFKNRKEVGGAAGLTGMPYNSGIVAMARRLLIDLWRFVEQGVVPDGARFKEA